MANKYLEETKKRCELCGELTAKRIEIRGNNLPLCERCHEALSENEAAMAAFRGFMTAKALGIPEEQLGGIFIPAGTPGLDELADGIEQIRAVRGN